MTPADHKTLALAAASAASTAVQELIEVGRGNADAGDLRQNEIVELLQDAVKMVRQIVGAPEGTGDERLIEALENADYGDGMGKRYVCRDPGHAPAILATIRASGYALVRTEGEEWAAMVERAARAICHGPFFIHGCQSRACIDAGSCQKPKHALGQFERYAEAALRAALNLGAADG